MYFSGLWVGVVVKIKPEDIDLKRGLIHIKGSKGGKDRYTVLFRSSLVILKKYYVQYEPKRWLFEGAKRGKHISTRTVQAIFKQACRRAGIKKEVSAQSLGHSFATHFLKGGVDLRYIQKIPGHKSSQATEIYTHVSKANIARIRNPFDTIFKEEEV